MYRGKCHAILRYNKEQEDYEIKALYPLYINRARKDSNDGYTPLHAFDCIYFDCARCPGTPHAYHFILPSIPKEKGLLAYSGGKGSEVGAKGKGFASGQGGQFLATKWTMDEREQLKKMLSIYGYERWNKIRKNSQELSKKPDTELRAYSIAFMKSILEYLNFEKTELKKYLTSIVDSCPSDDLYVPTKPSNNL